VGRTGSGVEVRARSIRLVFVYLGQPRRETIRVDGDPLPPTPANIKYVRGLSADLRKRLARGVFDDAAYCEFFPESEFARSMAMSAQQSLLESESELEEGTFGALADLWLMSKGRLADATRDQYATAVRFWKSLFGADTPISALTDKLVAARLGGHRWKSPKAHNNYLIALRGIFALEYRGRRSLDSPMIGVENMPVVKKLPDPLSAFERDRILADMAKHYDQRVAAYYQFMFYTGMRPEEAIALRWSDIDFSSGTARVQRVRTFRGSEREGSKTHAQRDVDLVPRALEALAAMKPYTFLKRGHGDREADVFENPVTASGWHDERSQRDHYWTPTLRRLGIRKRRSYSTRHTYCTVALMGGVNPAYIAAQAGHSPKMLLEVYARWIAGADGGEERRRLTAAMEGEVFATGSKEFFPRTSKILPQTDMSTNEKAGNPNEIKDLPALEGGRRDWTRTNDPHHVKVVL